MRDACEIVVYVRSRHVVTDAHEVRAIRPVAATLSQPAFILVRRFEVVYGHRLDWTQWIALAEARRLGARTGNPVRVVDLGRMNPVSRAVRRWFLGGAWAAHRGPERVMPMAPPGRSSHVAIRGAGMSSCRNDWGIAQEETP